jgi:hypothetical protein
MSRAGRGWVVTMIASLVLISALVLWHDAPRAFSAHAQGASTDSARGAAKKPLHSDPRTVSDAERGEAIARAHVWRAPRVAIGQADFRPRPSTPRNLSCKFKISELGGTTPKFDCDLQSGEEIRVKYGKGPEIPAEAAATRLLEALGFGADQITLVEQLRCHGCPEEPFSTMRAVELTRAGSVYQRVVDYSDFEDFEWVAVERKLQARPIETEKLEGWAFFELDQIDPARGGAPRAHVDALRLMALLLAHWDNKSENQRLVCLSREWRDKTACAEPFLLLQDVGATFGPSKMDLEAWKDVAIWDDRATCSVSMRDLPYNGATFADARISEEGRQFFIKLIAQLTDRQLVDLFTSARFDQKRGLFSDVRPVADWVQAFKAKRQAISDGPPCP